MPPRPVEISHKKDGCQRQPHRFHVSWPRPTWPLDPMLGKNDHQYDFRFLTSTCLAIGSHCIQLHAVSLAPQVFLNIKH